jgi:hypothetical protein
VNYEQYRALQEGFNAGMWDRYTGMLVWKNQNPWTSLRGQLYDVFLEQNGGFYGFMHGARALHVQLNLNDSSICVLNQTVSNAPDLHAEWELLNLHGLSLGKGSAEVSAEANTLQMAGKLFENGKPDGFCFARLKLRNGKGEQLDENLYWLTAKDADWLQLEELQPADIQVSVTQQENGSMAATIENTGQETAFFMRIKISERNTGELLLPVFMEDNYITLFPGEKRKIHMDLSNMRHASPQTGMQLEVLPWNGEGIKTAI